MMLTAVERAQKLFPRTDARPKITHCTLINPDLVRRIKALGAVPALFTTYAYYNSDKFHFYGEDMMKHMMAYRTLLDAGIPVCAGSDFSPGRSRRSWEFRAWSRARAGTEVWGANQRITVDEALRVNTINGAHATYEEAIKGSITAGQAGRLRHAGRRPAYDLAGEDQRHQDRATFTGGKSVYQA